MNDICYYGIKTNNLKNIDFCFKKGNIILLKGPSGSGKSSLALDTIHKISEDELYQLISLKDDISNYIIDNFEGILPSICLKQENYNSNPRSTIATYFNLDVCFQELFSSFNNISRQIFQFNVIENACPTCNGLGVILQPDVLKIVDYSQVISKKPFKTWHASMSMYYHKSLMLFCDENNINSSLKLCDLSQDDQKILLYGKSKQKYKIKYCSNKRNHTKTAFYKGPIKEIRDDLSANTLAKSKIKYLSECVCPTCNGGRFIEEIAKYKVFGKSISEIYLMEINELFHWCNKYKDDFDNTSKQSKVFRRILKFLNYMLLLNLNYLNLNRSIPSLSGGELQRLQLAKSINCHFTNFLYLLDEPTAGLHAKEWSTIKKLILELKEKGNTVLIIEHNRFLEDISDKITELGPVGGGNGGRIVTNTNPIIKGIDYQFFKGPKKYSITNASFNNINNLTLKLPSNTLVGVCGVSGSGKTSFLKHIVPKYIDGCNYLNQSAIRGNAYSIIATCLNIYTKIQDIYSKHNRVNKEFFSYSSRGKGQCEVCSGKGIIEEDSSYINSEFICPECNGKRFTPLALKYRFLDYNIYELLNLDIQTLYDIIPKEHFYIKKVLSFAISIGLGYLNLFQETSSLSGGEAQRVKLISCFFKYKNKKIFLLDEPFRGVDNLNIQKMINCFYKLINEGYTIYFAEHNLLALDYCSYIIEFGPESGEKGGNVVFMGAKEDIYKSSKSVILPFLKNNNSEI